MFESIVTNWIIIGTILVLLELLIPGIYLIWFGFAAYTMSILVYFTTLSISTQLIYFSFFSLIFALIGLYAYKYLFSHLKSSEEYINLNNPMQQQVGNKATLVEDVIDNRTKIKIGDTVWPAYCDTSLKEGCIVKITSVKNNMIFVVEKSD